MNIFITIFISYLIILTINSTIIDYLDRKTCFDNKNEFTNHYKLLFVFFGIFCLLFIKKIKEKRKIRHYEKKLQHLNFIKRMFGNYPEQITVEEKEILKINRILALNKLKNK